MSTAFMPFPKAPPSGAADPFKSVLFTDTRAPDSRAWSDTLAKLQTNTLATRPG